ncbi:MAG: type II toxin-antitoxin system VapC family toxin [Acetobacteraceae bacterium]
MKCLDTNAIIAALNNRPAAGRERLAKELGGGEEIGVPMVAWFEMIHGYEKSSRREWNKAALAAFLTLDVEPLPFELADAEHAGEIRFQFEHAGTPIGAYDLLVAAQARRRGATLVTVNGREFARVPDLTCEDWAA